MQVLSKSSFTSIPVATMANGATLALPLHEIRGRQPGPTLGLCAAIHGDEQTGVEIILRFVESLDPDQLKGRLLIVPVSNPLAFEAISRSTPMDMNNMNRVFPGSASGWVTEQMAHHMTIGFLDKIDYLVDLHAGGALCAVDYVYIQNDERLSRSFGSRLRYRPDPSLQGTTYQGTATTYTTPRGVRAVVVELGGGTIDQKPYVERGVAGLYNALRTIGMLPGEPSPRPSQIVLHEIAIIRPQQGGLLVPEVTALGAEVKGGTVLGRVVSPYTLETLETIRSPFERGVTVLLRANITKIQPGDYMYMIGNLDTAEPDE
jgi:hypothetical protein